MKNIKTVNLSKHAQTAKYKSWENGIYEDLADGTKFSDNFKLGLSFELENDEDTQYPLESLLDKYTIHVSEFIEIKDMFYIIELGGK